MPSATRRHDNESFESLFRRWKRAVENDGLLQTLRAREYYEKPSIRRKRAKAAAKKRTQRIVEQERENALMRRKPRSRKRTDDKKRKGTRDERN